MKRREFLVFCLPATWPLPLLSQQDRLVVNTGAAKRFGWVVPLSILAHADEVIE
jgi:hypothetical protein